MIVFRGYESNVVSLVGNNQDNDELLPDGTIHQRNESLFIIVSFVSKILANGERLIPEKFFLGSSWV